MKFSPKKNIFVKGFSRLRNKLRKLKNRYEKLSYMTRLSRQSWFDNDYFFIFSKKRKNEYIEHQCCGNSFRNQNQKMVINICEIK